MPSHFGRLTLLNYALAAGPTRAHQILGVSMVAYLKRKDLDDADTGADTGRPRAVRGGSAQRRGSLSRDMLHGLSPEEFDGEAKSLAAAESLTPQVRERMRMQLVERLKTPIDPPSWGPDWVKRGHTTEPLTEKKKGGLRLASLFPFGRKDDDEEDAEDNVADLDDDDQDDARVIAHNMEKSRQVWHFRGLYVLGGIAAITIALLAMFVDFQIVKGDIWTRALANEFMVVPASLQGTLLFKSMQVIFAVLIIHFMLKITGVYGRNIMVTTAFLFALVMIGCLGYLVAYNNMTGGTSATLEHAQSAAPASNSIDQLFASNSHTAGPTDSGGGLMAASMTTPKSDEASSSIPKPSASLLANADSWFWLAFASVIFFIVTTVAALYVQTFENNVRNFLISRDYLCRRKQFAQLHLLELAEKDAG
jgi:hypothetical protein